MVFVVEIDTDGGQCHVIRCNERQRYDVMDWANSLYRRGLVTLDRAVDAILLYDLTVEAETERALNNKNCCDS